MGVEPTTSSLRTTRSGQLSYSPGKAKLRSSSIGPVTVVTNIEPEPRVAGYRTRAMLRLAILSLTVFVTTASMAQNDDLAYVPTEAPARTADDATIVFRDTPEPGIVDVLLPRGTYQVDLLNAGGTVVHQLEPEAAAHLDLRTLRPGTWTVRAHGMAGIRVRRFVVLGQGGTLWVNQRQPPRR